MKILTIGIVIILILAAIYFFMIAPRMIHKPDRKPFLGVHYAHRGLFDNASEAPENSLPAFQKAVEAGYGIELDVQLSKDDVPMVFHDASLKRVCGVEGNIWEFTYAELRQMRLLNSQETIPTFEEVLNVIGGKVPIIVEYKMDRVTTKVCELGDKVLQNYKGIYCIESFHPFAVQWYKKNRPEVMRGQLSMDFSKEEKYQGFVYVLLTQLLTNVLARPDFIAYKHQDVKQLSRKVCKGLGALSVAWTIKNHEDLEKVKHDFDLFIFDSVNL